MIQVCGAAAWSVVDSGLIELEGVKRGINGNADWTNSVGGGLEIGFASASNVLEGADVSSLVLNVVFASVGSSGGVWVRFFAVDTIVVNDVLESTVHLSSLATIVSVLVGSAIDEVLLRETNKGVFSDKPLTFHGASGGEGPASTALSLVLDASDGTLCSPIEASWEGGLWVLEELRWVDDLISVSSVVVVSSSEFFVGHVTEFVHSESVSVVLLVVFADELQVGLEDTEALFFFLDRSIDLVVLGLPLVKEVSQQWVSFSWGTHGAGHGNDGHQAQKQ